MQASLWQTSWAHSLHHGELCIIVQWFRQSQELCLFDSCCYVTSWNPGTRLLGNHFDLNATRSKLIILMASHHSIIVRYCLVLRVQTPSYFTLILFEWILSMMVTMLCFYMCLCIHCRYCLLLVTFPWFLFIIPMICDTSFFFVSPLLFIVHFRWLHSS